MTSKVKTTIPCFVKTDGNVKITSSQVNKYPLVYQALRHVRVGGRSVAVLGEVVTPPLQGLVFSHVYLQ